MAAPRGPAHRSSRPPAAAARSAGARRPDHDRAGPRTEHPAAVFALQECSQAAADCERRCREVDPVGFSACIATCQACSAICATAADVLRLGDAVPAALAVAQVRAALTATTSTASKCAAHAEDATHQCRDVCSTTSETLESLLAHLERSTVTVRLR